MTRAIVTETPKQQLYFVLYISTQHNFMLHFIQVVLIKMTRFPMLYLLMYSFIYKFSHKVTKATPTFLIH